MRGTPPGGQGWTRTRHTHDTTTLRHQKLREQLLLVYCSAEATHASNPPRTKMHGSNQRSAKCTFAVTGVRLLQHGTDFVEMRDTLNGTIRGKCGLAADGLAGKA